MKFKKLVGAIAAATIAVSAFAGFGVSASAAGEYEIDEVLYGVEANGTVTPQTDFTDDPNEVTGVTFSDKNGNVEEFPIDGSVLTIPKSTAWEKSFDTAKTDGKIYFSCVYSIGANDKGVIKLVDNNNVPIFSSTMNGTGSNETVAVATINGVEIINYVRNPRTCGYKVSICVDLDANKVDYELLVSSGNGSFTTLKDSISGLTVDNIKGLLISGSPWGGGYIDNVALYSEKSSVELHDYTLTYMCDDTPIRELSASVEAGTSITAESPYWVEDGTKYFAVDGAETEFTVTADGDNDFVVNYRKAEEYSVTVNAVNSESETIQSAIREYTVDEGDNLQYYWPQYVIDGDTAYIESDGEDGYYADITAANDDVVKNVTYTKLDGKVVFHEDLDGSSGDNANVRASNGFSLNNAPYTSEEIIQPGTYTVRLRVQNMARGTTLNIGNKTIFDYRKYFTSEDEEGNLVESKGSWEDIILENVEITEAGNLVLNPGGSRTYDCLDTILILEPAPEITAVLNSAEITVDEPESVNEVIDGKENPEATPWDEVVTGEVQTLLIKVTNPTDGVVPTVTATDGTVCKPTKTDIINNTAELGDYFIYQFAGIDVTGAEVSYDGAESVTLPTPTPVPAA